ncbi:MAG: thiamine pyrophosphate-binding protein [Rhodospirillaceae bacterium]|nr:thiamine pyrophosphate-binding protein [Rhodospirillaceae bacterium]MDD9916618.1 thiamine pyrophosphate-binding protein [Rhodospirillaceae bacterium]
MRGADLVAKSLAEAGVRTIFTLSGNQIMPIFDACIDAEIRLIHTRHEAAAVYMADAWAQITGEVGIAMITAAPGFANGLSPLFSARAAESPVVLLSGDSPVAQDGLGAFQELSQADIAAPLTKAAFRSASTEGVGHDIAKAIRIARSGRPGPVHLALPFDLLNADASSAAIPRKAAFEADMSLADPAAIEGLARILGKAERPLIVTGPALNNSRAGNLLGELADAVDVPIVAMESPRGLKDPSLGAFAEMLPQTDLLVSLGKAIDFTLGFAKPPAVDIDCRFVVVDADGDAVERARRGLGGRLALALRADPRDAARQLLDISNGGEARAGWRKDVADAIAFRETGLSASGDKMPSWTLCEGVQRVLDRADDPILISDGGEFGQWAQAMVSAPTRVINGPSGAIGGGICYAIAAKLARPEATVIALMGDGTAGFHFSEFDTAVRAGAAIVAVIGNDARWNAEHLIQMRDYGEQRLIGCELNQTRYDLAAAGLGCVGEYVTSEDQLTGALERAVSGGQPACVNVEIEGFGAPNFVRG